MNNIFYFCHNLQIDPLISHTLDLHTTPITSWPHGSCQTLPNWKLSLTSFLNNCSLAEWRWQQSEWSWPERGAKSWTCLRPQRASKVSLTVLQGERGAVHRLAFGWSAALRVGDRVGVVNAAAKAGAQLQAPHVADHSRRIKGLLWRQGVNRQMWNPRQIPGERLTTACSAIPKD